MCWLCGGLVVRLWGFAGYSPQPAARGVFVGVLAGLLAGWCSGCGAGCVRFLLVVFIWGVLRAGCVAAGCGLW